MQIKTHKNFHSLLRRKTFRLFVVGFLMNVSVACSDRPTVLNLGSGIRPTLQASLATAAATNQRDVSLNLETDRAAEYALFVNQSCDALAVQNWLPIPTTLAIELPDLDQVHKLAVIVRDENHITSECQSFQVTLDRIGPAAPTAVTLNSNLTVTTETPHFLWPPVDDNRPIVRYEARLVNATGTEILTWTNMGSTVSSLPVQFESIVLIPGTAYTIEVRGIDDLGNIGGVQISPAFATAPTLSLANRTFNQGGVFDIDVAFSAPVPVPINLVFSMTDITAVDGLDYVAQTGTLNVAAGATGGKVYVNIRESFQRTTTKTFGLAVDVTNGSLGLGVNATMSAAVNTIQTQDVSDIIRVRVGENVICIYTGNEFTECSGDQSVTTQMLPNGTTSLVFPVSTSIPVETRDHRVSYNLSCHITAGGLVACAGNNGTGDLGDGTTTTATLASPVNAPLNDAIGVTIPQTGAGQICGWTSTGQAGCWGRDFFGTIGFQWVPGFQTINMGDPKVIQMAIGESAYCLLRDDGRVMCAGDNFFGQLATGSTGGSSAVPLLVPALTNIVEISGSTSNFCARTNIGAVFCWGRNSGGATGLENPTLGSNTGVPLQISTPLGVKRISVGYNYACLIDATDQLRCWGSNVLGKAGMKLMASHIPVVVPLPSGLTPTSVEARMANTCVIANNGETVLCMGANITGQQSLGVTPTLDANHYGRPLDLLPSYPITERIQNSGRALCKVTALGVFECYGSASPMDPLLTVSPAFQFGAFQPHSQPLKDLQIGTFTACAILKSNGSVVCSGDNGTGQLGNGDLNLKTTSTWLPVVGLPGPMESLATTGQTFCARSAIGAVYCWGRDQFGERGADPLGAGYAASQPSPARVQNLPALTSLYAGYSFFCGLTADGEAHCWGRNNASQLGDGTTTNRFRPVSPSGNHRFSKLDLGYDSACGIRKTKELYCWGQNTSGQLGVGDNMGTRTTPTAVPDATNVDDVILGSAATCLLKDQNVFCAGSRTRGLLGDGRIDGGVFSFTKIGNLNGQVRALYRSASAITSTSAPQNAFCAEVQTKPTQKDLKCWGLHSLRSISSKFGYSHILQVMQVPL